MRLDLYFARRFLRAILLTLGIFSGLIVMIETVNILRDFADQGITAGQGLTLSLLRLPPAIYELLPIILVIATLILFLGLARSSELVVARASGRSAMRSLLPVVTVALLFGLFTIAILNPISAKTEHLAEARETELNKGETQKFSVSDDGLWLREGTSSGQIMIRASRSNLDASELFDVSFFGFSRDGVPLYRIEAATAKVYDGQWHLTKAKRWPLEGAANPEAAASTSDSLTLTTALTLEEIQDRFGTAKAVSIWDMKNHIQNLETAGFSARSYKMWLQAELALPLSFVAMVLIGAGLTMRHTRLGNTSLRVLIAILLAFGFFFLRSFAIVLGSNGYLPIEPAAWGPPIAVILAALALLLHLEDG